LLAFCGQKELGLSLLKSPIDKNYCAVTPLQSDPFLSKLRGTADFSQPVTAAKACQNRFRAQTNQGTP
jgi:hypothetical protein